MFLAKVDLVLFLDNHSDDGDDGGGVTDGLHDGVALDAPSSLLLLSRHRFVHHLQSRQTIPQNLPAQSNTPPMRKPAMSVTANCFSPNADCSCGEGMVDGTLELKPEDMPPAACWLSGSSAPPFGGVTRRRIERLPWLAKQRKSIQVGRLQCAVICSARVW
eukprot:CAMPEP_0198131286 /NCGR_PEP_ID=MMETSP1442-20131203/55836_1 /TAXON_ID= /ORGANISM="Craspedostauros australis, Strain CCMP3328" /LENGTH=160 /DNA_ID=CAMNT_0043792065 /DNA_START=219 /DNA_END=699 /DNA_ORIENTATION=+